VIGLKSDMGLNKQMFFPDESRFLPGQRWLNVLFRTSHLVGLGGLGAGFLYPGVGQEWLYYLYVTLASGVGLTLISIYSNGIWLIQLRGQIVMLKLLLMAIIPLIPAFRAEVFIAVIVLSGWISHAPARIRYYSIYHGKKVDSLH